MLKSVTKLPDENVWQTKFPTDTCQTTSPSWDNAIVHFLDSGYSSTLQMTVLYLLQ
jgi:hypothetical protein